MPSLSRSLFIIVAAFMAAAGPAAALAPPPPPQARSTEANALVDAIARTDQLSGVALVAVNGKVLFRRPFGYANLEWDIPNVPEGKFRLGSVTKQFTAAAILQLQQAGKLSVDDPVSKHYTDAPVTWKDVTIKHLLTHTSGIHNYTSVDKFFAKEARIDRTPLEIIELTKNDPLDFPPGSQFRYDNSGYILLGYIIEKVSGERYQDYLQNHIFKPLGMTSTGYDVSADILHDRTYGYDRTKAGLKNASFISMSEPYSAGSLYSTVDDLMRWTMALQAGKILSPESMAAMFSDYGHGYGFGWFVDSQFGRPRVSHGGNVNGFSAMVERYPKDGLTVIVLTNESGAPAGRLAEELSALYLGVAPRAAHAGGEAIVSRTVQDIVTGTPHFETMSPKLADTMRLVAKRFQTNLSDMGALNSVSLISAEPAGMDRYRVSFGKGAVEADIKIDDHGLLDAFQLAPIYN